MAKVLRTFVLIDAHAVLHRAYHALPGFTSATGEPTGALYGVAAFLIKIIRDLQPTYIAACYDLAGPTFRHEAYKEYKGTRQKTDDALIAQMDRSREIYQAFGVPIYDKPGFEADDMLGTITELLKKEKGLQVIIASGDMDTVQLVKGDKVVVYTLKKGLNDTIVYNEAGVNERFGFGPELLTDYKGLRGDPSDNIPGVPGIGEKTATELITKFGSIESLYKKIKKDRAAVEAEGIKARIVDLLLANEEGALFSKLLATIRRDAPIDFSIPAAPWSLAPNKEAITKLFGALGFKSLLPRLKDDPTVVQPEQAALVPLEEISKDRLREASLGLWLLDSTRAEPDQAEILEWAKTETFEIAEAKIKDKLKETGSDKVLNEIELPVAPIFDAASARGILIDRPYLAKLSKEYHEEFDSLQKKIWKAAGEEFNISSPKQLGEILFEKMQLKVPGLKKTAGGAPSTRESELEKLREGHPIIDDILSYRELQKLLSNYIDVLPTLADAEGRVHSHFVQSGAATGRVASRDPNMQNIPIKSEAGEKIRRAFIAAPGWKLLDIDYSQIQLRILAMLSADEKLLAVFKGGGDIHEVVARNVFQVPSDSEVTKDMRRRAKVINFGIIFGMGANALRQNLGTSRKEAEQFLADYFAQFPGVANYIENVKAEARAQGFTETLFGRRRYFPTLKRGGGGFMAAAEERMAMNAPNQGTEADILKLAMVVADKELKKAGLRDDAHLLLQVHDELVYEVKEEKVKEVAKVIKKALEGIMDGNPKARGVPLTVNVAVGDNWGETEEIL